VRPANEPVGALRINPSPQRQSRPAVVHQIPLIDDRAHIVGKIAYNLCDNYDAAC
jgi:hypothetical protein